MSLTLGSERYLGETRTCRHVADLALTETVHRLAARLPLHTHQAPYFCLVLDGGFSERVGSRIHEARPGTLLFHPPGETHADEIRSAGTSLLNVALGGSWERRIQQLEPGLRPMPGLQSAAAAHIARRIADEMATQDPLSTLRIEGLVLTLLAEAARSPARPRGGEPRWLPVALEFIRAQFRSRFDHQALARVAGVHPTHLARAFHAHVGCTVGGYVRRLRLAWARERLTRSDDSLAELALDAGFADQAHLTRWFRRETGMTPSAYRRGHRQPRD